MAARLVTKEEHDFYHANGWVHLKGLIDPAAAAVLLERVQARIGFDSKTVNYYAPGTNFFDTYPDPDADEVIRQFTHSRELGSVAAHLLGRPVRRWNNVALVKPPRADASIVTPWHQDLPYLPHDRVGRPNIWIALAPVPAERGSLRFLSGSNRAGMIGRFIHTPERDALATYPELSEEYPISPPLDLEPGDATVHESPTLHAAAANGTDEARWSLVSTYVGSDVLFTGMPSRLTADIDLKVNEVFEHPKFPLVDELARSW